MIVRTAKRPLETLLLLATIVTSGCQSRTPGDRQTSPSATADAAAVTTGRAAPDVARALDLSQFTSSQYLGTHGSCLSAGSGTGRSRLLYVMLPNDTAYFRLSVATSSDGSRIQTIDFVRGIDPPRMLAATIQGAGATMRVQTFASASDQHPAEQQLPGDGAAARELRDLANAALSFDCSKS